MDKNKFEKQFIVPSLEERKKAIEGLTDSRLREILTKHLPVPDKNKKGEGKPEKPWGIELSLPTGDRDE